MGTFCEIMSGAVKGSADPYKEAPPISSLAKGYLSIAFAAFIVKSIGLADITSPRAADNDASKKSKEKCEVVEAGEPGKEAARNTGEDQAER